MQKRGARRRPFELQTLRFRRERGDPKEVNPITTAQVDNHEVLRDYLGDGTYVSQSPRRVVQGSLGRMEGKDTHTHTHTRHASSFLKKDYELQSSTNDRETTLKG